MFKSRPINQGNVSAKAAAWLGLGLLFALGLAGLLVILTTEGGFIGAFSWWFGIPGSFAWQLPGLAGRMLAAAGWCFSFVGLMALLRPTARRLRYFLLMLAVYMLPIAAAVILFHLDALDFRAPITYPFLAVVGLLSGMSIFFLLRPPGALPDPVRDLRPPPGIIRGWLAVLGVLTLLWGLALFITDAGPLAFIWVWPGDQLSSRLIAVMLFTLAALSFFGRGGQDSATLTLVVAQIYGFGVALASLWNLFAGSPIKWAYLLVFGFVFLGSSLMHTFRYR